MSLTLMSCSDFKEQTFGNCIGYRLCNNRITQTVLDKLERYYKLELFKPFGRVDKEIEVEVPNDVKDYEHLINFHLKDPISYIYLTDNMCYYITGTSRRDCKLVSTIQRFSKEILEQDTMMSGYLLKDIFLVEDLIIYGGHTCKKPLEQRVKLLNHILDYQYTCDPIMDNYKLVLKDYVDYTYLQSFVTEYLQALLYKDSVDGVIFSPLGNCIIHYIMKLHQQAQAQAQAHSNMNSGSGSGSDQDRFEIIKEPKRDQACFLVKSTDKPDVFHLYLSTGSRSVKYYDIASIPDSNCSARMRELFKNCTEAHMICKYDNRGHIKRWQPMMISNRTSPDTIYRIR